MYDKIVIETLKKKKIRLLKILT